MPELPEEFTCKRVSVKKGFGREGSSCDAQVVLVVVGVFRVDAGVREDYIGQGGPKSTPIARLPI